MKTRKWKVSFMRKGWEPPYPFGKSEEIVEASSRQEAIDMMREHISPRYKAIASPVKEAQ